MQEKMFHTGAYIHMCLNADCFYCEVILDITDAVYKEVWDSNLEDVVPIPHCPSCGEILWRERNDTCEPEDVLCSAI